MAYKKTNMKRTKDVIKVTYIDLPISPNLENNSGDLEKAINGVPIVIQRFSIVGGRRLHPKCISAWAMIEPPWLCPIRQ
jgi:hypothetical protein